MVDQGTPVDGINRQQKMMAQAATSGRGWRRLLIGGGVLYLLYIMWSFFLISFLPRPGETMQWLVLLGIFIAFLVSVLLLALGTLALRYIRSTKNINANTKIKALIRVGIGIAPGLLLGVITPLMIMREYVFPIILESPALTEDLMAPVTATFSLKGAADTLAQYGMQALRYEWDFDSDGKANQLTVLPSATTIYNSEGIHRVAAKIFLENGNIWKATHRLVIQQASVLVTPSDPIREKEVIFSLSRLIDDPKSIVQITWDFESDGIVDATTKTPEAIHTYYRNGRYTMTAIATMQNKTVLRYQRSFDVKDSPLLPFPVAIVTEPGLLIGTPPFSVFFRLKTDEPIANVTWSFGDNTKEDGLRVAHTYQQTGTYPVVSQIYSKSGALAELVHVVRVVEKFQIPDLTFVGSHPVLQGKIEGEAPLKLMLTPQSSLRGVAYEWEAPDAANVESTKTKLIAFYRLPGTYTVVLVAENTDQSVTRIPITVIVHSTSSIIDFRMDRDGGVAPLTITFDASIANIPGESITGFEWSFGDEQAGETFIPGPAYTTHRYKKPGRYEVTLRARTVSGKNEGTQKKIIVVREQVFRACAAPSRLSGAAPLQVAFDGRCSTGAEIYEWNFGDGTASTGPTFIHIFEEPGTYQVTLTVRDAKGVREDTWTTTISVQ